MIGYGQVKSSIWHRDLWYAATLVSVFEGHWWLHGYGIKDKGIVRIRTWWTFWILWLVGNILSFCPVVLVFGTSWLVSHLDLRTQAQVHDIIGCYDIGRTSIYLICKAFIGSYTSSDITWMLSSRRCFDFTRCKYNDIKIISKLQNYFTFNVKIKWQSML